MTLSKIYNFLDVLNYQIASQSMY